MKQKKESKSKEPKTAETKAGDAAFGVVSSRTDLKAFLLSIRDKMEDQTAAPIYALSALNHVMIQPGVYAWLDNDNKEIARDIWLRLKQAGLQLRNPPLLFSEDEGDELNDGR